MSDVVIKVKKLHPNATIPDFERDGDAGADICACLDYNVYLNENETVIIPTGLAFEIPRGYEIQVRSRSGLAAKYGIFVLNSPGTVDSGFRGEVKIILSKFNGTNIISKGFGSKDIIKHGDRIAQIVLNKLPSVSYIETNELSTETHRGVNGFGSTGL